MSEEPKKEEDKKEDQPEKQGEEEVSLRWPPLESDPTIFNEYFSSIGKKPDVYFKELLSLVDISAFLSISGPLLGVILNFSREEKTKEEIEKLKEEQKNKFPQIKEVPYFMKQTHQLDNACGLIAALHVFGNCKNGQMKFETDSVLDKFFSEAKKLSPMDRALLLEKDEKFKKAHKHFSNKGQTDMKKELKNDYVGHYIAFVNINGKLVEFDGIKEWPRIIKEGINDGNFLNLTLEEILRRINSKEIKEQVNVMVVADQETQLVDFLAE
jgi:hypothetical protein